MGCGGSKAKSFEEIVSKPAFKQSLLQFRSLQLTLNDLKKIYKVFVTMDIDGSGTISLAELLAHLDLPRTAYTEKIFSIFDDDGSGAIDFREFVLSVWNYCTLTKVNLDMFAFDLYDTDGSGELSPSEVMKLLQEIFGKNDMKTDVHARSATAEISQFQAKKIKFDPIKFHHFMGNHQALMFPSIQMQQALHRKVCGATFWEKHTKNREARSHGVYMSLAHFLLSPEEMSLAQITSTGLSNSESNGSAHFNTSLNGSMSASVGRAGSGVEGAAAKQMKAMVSGMAALKIVRAKQLEAKKLQAELLESGNATGQTVLNEGGGGGGGTVPMTQSAKVRWVQSMQQGMSGLMGSIKQKRKLGRNKVYVSGSSSTMASTSVGSSLGAGSATSILTTVGMDAPVSSIPKPGSHAANREREKEREKEKEAEKEVTVRSRARSQHRSNTQGNGSAGSSAVASPVVSPREPQSQHHYPQHHSQHSKADKLEGRSKHHSHDYKHRGSVSGNAGGELSRRKTVR